MNNIASMYHNIYYISTKLHIGL